MILQNWYHNNYNADGTCRKELSSACKKQYGEVKQALIALENDLHNLSIIYHQLLHFKYSSLEAGLKNLYFSSLTESYFTNVRSIYDHISCFPRIVLNELQLREKVAKVTSFNDLLGFCNNGNYRKRKKAEMVYSQVLLASFEKCKYDFDNIKKIRDAIIHHGKEPAVSLNKGDKILFRIPIHVGNYYSKNLLPNVLGLEEAEYPLMDYIRNITVNLFVNMECIGNSIGNDYMNKSHSEQLCLYGLIGICIKDFVSFLFPNGKRYLFYPDQQ